MIKKDWGQELAIYNNNNVIVKRLEIKKGGVSTFGRYHRHRHNFNRFFLEKGKLKIYIESATTTCEILLEVDKEERLRKFDVFPGVRHRFEALEDSIVYELYWTNTKEDDIIRDEEK